jgi:CRP/FNR family transcriptional regulator, nitrogen oxide reductase regulator
MNESNLLAHSPLFAPLDGEEQRALTSLAIRRKFDEGAYLFFEGDPAEWLIMVAEGRVKMIKHSESGRETILATFGPGQIVGEVGVLIGEAYPATAQALEATLTLSVPRARYAQIVRTNPDLAWALIAELGRRLLHAHETIRSMAVEKVDRRVARVLLRMASAAGERLEGGAVRLTVRLSRQDIADMAGTVVETAIRTLSRFQREGLVETSDGYLVLLRPHQLVAIAEEL